MKVLISERQKILILEQGGIFGKIIKYAKDLENIKFVNLEVPKIKISKLVDDIANFNSKQLKFLSDIEKNVDVASNFKKYSSYKVELDNIFKNFYFDFFKDVDLDLDLKLIYKKINDGDNSWVKLIDNSEAEDFLLKYYMLLQQRKDYFRILLDKIKIKYVEGKNIFIENTDKENWEQLIGLRKSNVIDDKQFFFFMKNPKEWFSKKVEFNISPTKSELDITTDNLLDEIPNLTDGEIRKRIEIYKLMGRDDLVKILKKEIDVPKNVKQVAGVKVDISKSDLEKINSSVKKRGVKNWGMVDGTSNLPVSEKILVNGEETYFSLNENGYLRKWSDTPKHSDGTDLFPHFSIKARESMQLGVEPFGDIPPEWIPYYIEGFKKEIALYNKNNNTKYKFKDFFFNTPVDFGVQGTDYFGNNYIFVNPKKLKNYYGGNVVDEILNTIEHELVHVKQKSDINNRNKYNSNFVDTEKDALKRLQMDKISTTPSKEYEMFGSMDEFKIKLRESGLGEEFAKLKRKYFKETGKDVYRADTGNFTENFMKYFNESDFNKKYATKIENGKTVVDPKKMLFIGSQKRKKKPLFNKKDKAKAYRYYINLQKVGKNTGDKAMLDNLLKKSDSELVDLVENNKKYYSNKSTGEVDKNVEDLVKSLENVLINSSNQFTYFSNIIEIEAEFTALIKDILRKGTDVDNKGLTTFLVDWLRKDRLGKIDDIINKDKTPLKNLSNSSIGVLTKMTGEWVKIFPDLGKKLYNDTYKQLYNLIKNKYPALLPLIPATFTMLNEPKTQNESIKNFNKLIITESQYKLLKEFKKKAYSFDWDDNILIMPTRIHLEYNVNSNDIADLGSEGNNIWVPVSVSTEQFRSVRHKLGKDFRYPNNDIVSAFKDFRDYDAFIEDTKRALSNRSYGPSFNKFKEALISGSDFSIITARSNPPQAIKEGIKVIIRDMSWSEEKEMEKNLNGLTIDEYLNLQDYHPVSSEEFAQRFGLESVGTNPEEGKKIAFKSFVDRIVSQISKIKDDEDFEGISVGFSDDDEGNVEVIEDLIRDELKRLHPEITFTVYDTSDPKDTKKKRIIIKK